MVLRKFFPAVYEGWFVVGSTGFISLIIAGSFFYGFGAIFTDVIREFGWSMASTALAFSLRSEIGGIAAPLVGILIDRIGPQRVMAVGLVVAASGVVGLSFIQNLWQFYVGMIIIACGTSACGGQVGMTSIATWFHARRTAAMSYMALGGGFGGVLVVGVAWLVQTYGWRMSLRLMGLIIIVVGMLATMNVRARPKDHPQPMDGIGGSITLGERQANYDWGIPVRHVFRLKSFMLISLALIANQFAIVSLVVHQMPYLEKFMGQSKAAAATSVAMFTVFSMAGRLGFGYLGDRYPKRYVMAATMVLGAVGMVILAVASSYWLALVGILLIGQGFGGSIPVRPAMLADYFGTKYFGAINGISALLVTTGGAIGPWVVGYLVDTTGSYRAGWAIAAIAAVIAVPAMLAAKPPQDLIDEHKAANLLPVKDLE